MIDNFPAVLNFNQLILKLNRFICNYLPVLPDHWIRVFPSPTGYMLWSFGFFFINYENIV
jgi:hypothetical protein